MVDLARDGAGNPHQQSITKDNAGISMILIYWKVVEPVQSVVQVRNFVQASQARTTAPSSATSVGPRVAREHINMMLRTKLDEVTERWASR